MPESETPHPLQVYWTCPQCTDYNVSIDTTRCPRCQFPLYSWRPEAELPTIEALNENRFAIGELEYRNGVMIWVYVNALLTTGPTMNSTPADIEAWHEQRTNGTTTNGATTNGATTNGGTTYRNNTDGDTTDEDTAYAGRTNGGRPNGVTTNGGTTNGARTNGSTTNGGRTNGATTNGNQGRR